MSRVVISPLAEDDLGKITDHHLVEAGLDVTTAFLLAWDRCTDHIDQFPESGSSRLAEKVALGPIRVWPVKGFPHLAIYVVEPDQVVVLPVLHAARDIPATLQN